jgi:hypothetical protein
LPWERPLAPEIKQTLCDEDQIIQLLVMSAAMIQYNIFVGGSYDLSNLVYIALVPSALKDKTNTFGS